MVFAEEVGFAFSNFLLEILQDLNSPRSLELGSVCSNPKLGIKKYPHKAGIFYCGGGGIRTHVGIRLHAFQACGMDHYPTPPSE